jgi:UDP-N-acetylmuramate dehydrogenase
MIQRNAELQGYNTFGISATASGFATFSSVDELKELLKQRRDFNDLLILGGGSNILFTKDVDALVLRNEIGGITVSEETDDYVVLKAGSGVVWHDFVMHTVDQNLGGIENLSLIPGSVGASPMQNIGAYGVEIKDVFVSLEALNIATGELRTFTAEECKFGYRESVFKRELKNQYVITHVSYRLSKKPVLQTSYGAIKDELAAQGCEPSVKNISNAVIAIRNSKLPNPKDLGNAGSFFKNPVVPAELANKLSNEFPGMPSYPQTDGSVKLAAGWLIEQAGWKGKRVGDCGVHAKQALVLVNYGGASGNDIYNLSSAVLKAVEDKFGVRLEREVNIW